MTNQQLEAIYTSAVDLSHLAGLKAVFNAGFCIGKGITPNSTTPDVTSTQTAPSSYVKIRKAD